MSESETRRHKARRPHNKSRTGCVQCKQRKVKCDETKPVCKKCTGYGATCSFLQTHPQPGAVLLPGSQMQQPATSFQPTTRGLPTIQSMLSPESLPLTPPQPNPPSRPKYPVNFTMLDLELLHYFILEAAESYLEKSNIAEAFRTSVLQIAFEHPFLMHELLSLSALSLAHHRPEKRDVYLHASDTHTAAGLALFQPEVANLGPGNCHACFVFSTTFLTHAWVAQDLNKPSTLFFRSHIEDHESVTIQWVKLHRGTNAILDQFFPLFCEGPLKALLSPWKDLDPDRADPINEEEERHLHFLAEAWRDSLILSEDEKHILDKAALAVRRVYSMLVYYPEVGRLSVVMNWFSIIPDEFVKMLEEKRPEALLVAIYQCVALKQLDHVWWTQGKAENLFKTLYDVLPDQWEAWTLWPMEKVFGSKDALLRKQWKIPNET